MSLTRRKFTGGVAAFAYGGLFQAADDLAAWKGRVKITPVAPENDRHSIHSYFNTCPESPDGKWVLYFSSGAENGESGEIRIRSRATGEVRVLAKGLVTEDAHRVACQQWSCGGRKVVFHDFRNNVPTVVAIDITTGKETILATDRLVWWGTPNGNIVPLYGKQWNPGKYPDLQFANVVTGEIITVLKAADVRTHYPAEIAKEFGDKPISICFPALSPDGNRVFFKIAVAEINPDGNFRSPSNSHRETIVVYHLAEKRFLFIGPHWGHPAWFADSRRIINVNPAITDSDTGQSQPIPGIPAYRGGPHPSPMPNQKLFVEDAEIEKEAGKPSTWGVVVGKVQGNDYVVIDRFDNSRGATTWRHNHPHPVTSADSRRIYFNKNDEKWTRLYVAETTG
jgi:hypothetical protein